MTSEKEGDNSSAESVHGSDLHQVCSIAERLCRRANFKATLHSMASYIGAWHGLQSEQMKPMRQACHCWNHSIVVT